MPLFLRLSLSVLLLSFTIPLLAQTATQTIRGVVTDQASGAPIPYAAVAVVNTSLGAVSDSVGVFVIPNVPVGRYDVRVSILGYEPSVIREVTVNSSKQTYIQVPVKEAVNQIGEVTVKLNVNKEEPLNNMVNVSGRMLSVDEASRYAGGFDDPARLASSFAGVASNVGNNGIVVRGNAPKSLQWKMEGVEIPNPNHFADLSAFGGGGLTALSSQMLANSGFYTGAFPAEYSNALSGVFDIFLRNGNNQKYEHTIQLGVIGINASSEGPFSRKNKRGSYLFNYRYSTLALLGPILPDNGGGVRYQDLSFKLNFPTKKAGTFSLWGIGLLDHSGAKEKSDSTQWKYVSDKEKQDVSQYMGAMGLNHRYYFNNRIYLNTTLAATVNGLTLATDRLNEEMKLSPYNRIKSSNWNFVLSTYLNTKTTAKHTNKSGIIITGLLYDMQLKSAVTTGTPLQTMVNQNGFSALVTAYSQSAYSVTNQFTINAGVNAQVFTLNGRYTIEPRLGFKWQFKPAHAISLGYGLHSRLERLNYYFTKNATTGNALINKDMRFAQAHHLVLGYDLRISEYMHLKVEAYFQHQFNVPVIADSSFSFINLQNEWFFDSKVQSTGLGRNYGLDITFEKYLNKGYYYLFSASFFNSTYRGGDGVWRNTRYNRNYLLNFLIGKEWAFGKKKQSVFSLNTRLSFQGGDRYSPVNTAASLDAKDVVIDETKAYTKQLAPAFTAHLTVSYRINKKKTAHVLALKMINVTMAKEFSGFQYNYVNNTVDARKEAIFIPNISYKIEF